MRSDLYLSKSSWFVKATDVYESRDQLSHFSTDFFFSHPRIHLSVNPTNARICNLSYRNVDRVRRHHLKAPSSLFPRPSRGFYGDVLREKTRIFFFRLLSLLRLSRDGRPSPVNKDIRPAGVRSCGAMKTSPVPGGHLVQPQPARGRMLSAKWFTPREL